jgi:hypothetical protein
MTNARRHRIPSRLPESKLREVAVAASADPRTIRKVLRGEPTRLLVRERILAAIEALGLADSLRKPEQA